MKNQSFGDNKNLFAYDPIYQIMQTGMVNHFTFIPMLTENDNKKEGEKSNREKPKVEIKKGVLMGFLNSCIKHGRKDIKELEPFFTKSGINMIIYDGEQLFSNERRREYFKRIDNELLKDSLVFVNPDIGLEVKNPKKEHLLFSEVKDLYERMDENSILMIRQHFPRENHPCYLNKRMEEIKETIIDDFPLCIDNDERIFFLLTRDSSLEHSLIHVIGDYAESYS